ncbi:MAG: putative toxin-antitoxin system toxin component, PIN family [Defluviitaleaceae bacterium]|nr:putative toxin-antitoxin system toxin component, PIN family [Defluviitaleaceae bacterium]
MYKVVIDTNVLIFSIHNPSGTPAEIIQLVLCEEIQLYYSKGIINEYKKVLARPKHKLTIEEQNLFISDILDVGIMITPKTSNIDMRDEKDRIFYDTARESNAILITGDKDLLVLQEPFIMQPHEFLEYFRKL